MTHAHTEKTRFDPWWLHPCAPLACCWTQQQKVDRDPVEFSQSSSTHKAHEDTKTEAMAADGQG